MFKTDLYLRHELPEPDDKKINNSLRSERRTIETTLDKCLLLPIVGMEEPRTVYDWSENDIAQFTTLISIRRLHQRRQAWTGVRTHLSTPPTEVNTNSSDLLDVKEDPTPAEETRQSRRNLLRQFQAVIKAEEDRGVTTAVGRSLRWQPGRNPATTSTPSNVLAEPTLTGNSANAKEVAATEANKVCLYT